MPQSASDIALYGDRSGANAANAKFQAAADLFAQQNSSGQATPEQKAAFDAAQSEFSGTPVTYGTADPQDAGRHLADQAPVTADNRGLGNFNGVTNPNGVGVQVDSNGNAVQPAQPAGTAQPPIQKADGTIVNPADAGYQATAAGTSSPVQAANAGTQSGSSGTGGTTGAGSGLQMPDFSKTIGQRPSPSNPNTTEYYNTQTGEGFANPQALSKFINDTSGQQLTTPENVFGYLDQQQQAQKSQGEQTLTGNGIDPSTLSSNDNPYQTFTTVFEKVLTDMGLPDIKAQFEATQKQYSDLANELNDKIAKINDDPWEIQGVKDRQIKNLTNQYDGKLKVLQSQIDNYQKLYDSGKQQAEYVATQATTMIHEQAVLDQTLLIKKMNLAAAAAKTADAAPKTVKIGSSVYEWNADTKTYDLLGGGGGGGGGGTGDSLTSKQTARVKAIIAANPGEYGHAANQIDAEFGAGTATKADNLLKTAYIIPDNAIKAQQLWNSLSGGEKTLANWTQGLTVFENAHPYNKTAAQAAYQKAIPKPSSNSSGRTP